MLAMIPTLPQAIEVFKMLPDVQKWADPVLSRHECGEASAAFALLCNGCGLPARARAFIGLPEYVRIAREAFCPIEEGEKDCHVLVEVGDLFVDWTRRQYDTDADWPTVCTLQQMEAEGWEVCLPTSDIGTS